MVSGNRIGMPESAGDPSSRPACASVGAALFLLSGALSLIYEVSWVRALTLEMGADSLAVATVVAVFLGGLALGARLGGPWADRMVRPFLVYGCLEILLGLYALATPALIGWVLPAFVTAIVPWRDHFLITSLLRVVCTCVLLLPPTLLMGASLPLVTRAGAAWVGDAARWAGLLYGLNTIGAFGGTLLAGFLLLPYMGLTRTLFTAGGASLLLGVIALAVGRAQRVEGILAIPPETRSQDRTVRKRMAIAVALTGFSALACEVIWTRVLVLVLGSSVYAFTIVLATFLAGSGLGSLLAATALRPAPDRAVPRFYALCLVAAVLVILASGTFALLPKLFVALFWKWNLQANANLVFPVEFLLAALVLLGPSLVMGGLLPVALRAYGMAFDRAGRASGTLYAWSTAGSILGALAAGFLLIPGLGIRGGLQTAAVVQCVAAGLAAGLGRGGARPFVRRAAFAIAVGILILNAAPGWDRQLMTSGVFRDARLFHSSTLAEFRDVLSRRSELLFYRDGIAATVTVSRDREGARESIYLATNGKIDASSHEDRPTQSLLAHLPMLCHPNPERVCVIGMGSGGTAGTAALYPSAEIVVVEIEKAVVDAARLFKEVNYDVHARDRVRIVLSDGRFYLRGCRKEFDVIISEPSNPWLAGSSDLFTEEFYRLAAGTLREDGLFCQWVPMYGLSPESYRMVIRTFLSSFPHSYLFEAKSRVDTLLLGCRTPFVPDLALANARLAWPGIVRDLADPATRVNSIYDLAARFRAGPGELRELAGDGPLHTDDLPRLAYRAPRELYLDTRDLNQELVEHHGLGLCPYLREAPQFGRGPVPDFFQKLAMAYRISSPGGREAGACLEKAGNRSGTGAPVSRVNALEPSAVPQ